MLQAKSLMFEKRLMVNGSPDMDLEPIMLSSLEVLEMDVILPLMFFKVKGDKALTVGWEAIEVIWEVL